MKIIKRSGVEVIFDIQKVTEAIRKANEDAVEKEKLTEEQIQEVSNNVHKQCKKAKHSLGVEDIQNLVENELMSPCSNRRYTTCQGKTERSSLMKALTKTPQESTRSLFLKTKRKSPAVQ